MIGLRLTLEGAREAGAAVSEDDASVPAFRRRSQTDSSGRFCFDSLKAGAYRVQPSPMQSGQMGFSVSKQRVEVTLTPGDSLVRAELRYRAWGLSPEMIADRRRRLDELAARRAQWQRMRPRRYLMAVRHTCGCVIPLDSNAYEFEGTTALATHPVHGQRCPIAPGDQPISVDSLFDELERELKTDSREADAITYDARWGFPSHFNEDSRAPITDAWDDFRVTRFAVIAR